MLDEVIEKISSRNVTAVQGDVSNIIDLDNLYNVISKEKDCLDIVIANVGVSSLALLGSITEKQFNNIFNINVKGVSFTVQKVLPISVDGRSIVLIGSVSSIKDRRQLFVLLIDVSQSILKECKIQIKDNFHYRFNYS
jgi:NADP-dependent 3-hydroxy acid dehydrogenase YdfG